MKINWFPGHMHKARLQIKETLPQVDLLIEVLDARIPWSSENPMLAELRGEKPVLKVLAKYDLADPDLTQTWIGHFEKTAAVKARPVTTKDIPSIRKLKSAMIGMMPHKSGKTITTMVVGIPNVGKSTIINILAGKKVAKTGNEPAVTKGQQRINIGDGIFLLDTPGVLWPNVENIKSGFRLAAIGSVKETALDYADVGFFVGRFLLQHFPERLLERFGLEETPADVEQLINAIGRKRGCLGRSGVVDIDRTSKILVTELRQGTLGRLTLETPSMIEIEKIETARDLLKKEEKKKIKDAKRKKRFQTKQRAQRKAREHRR
ncbi:MAG: ribosome biogenesis GTPase YlqF [Pirellulaceae bacterium]|nr:ribosome biogenesis GTPase YlqF [Pirellulaceae bacterium]